MNGEHEVTTEDEIGTDDNRTTAERLAVSRDFAQSHGQPVPSLHIPVKRSHAVTFVIAAITAIAGLTGGTSYLGTATGDAELRARMSSMETKLENIEDDVAEIKLDLKIREIKGDDR